MRPLIFFLLTALLLRYTHNYEPCPIITLGNYRYDLSSLKTSDSVMVLKDGIITQISPCKAINCSGFPSFITRTSGTLCQSYTYNPLRQMYQFFDTNSPQKGLVISFLPLVKDNITYTAQLALQCKASSTQDKYCQSKQTTINNTLLRSIKCVIPHQIGCPSVTLSYFWDFLSRNSLPFAIVIWIVSLIELLFSYFIIRITIMIFGIMTGLIFGVINIAISYNDFISQSQGMCMMVIMLSFIMGLLLGICLLTLPRIGYVNIGVWVAVVVGLLLQNSVLYLTQRLIAFYIVVGILAIIMSGVALLAMRFFIVISTTFLSAFGLVRPLGFFLPNYPNQLNTKVFSATPWQFYLYLIGIIIITILGSAFQFCLLKSKGRGKGNQAYYLQEDGPFREKLAKLLDFKEFKQLAKKGKDQVMFFKNLLTNKNQQEQSEQYIPRQVQMKKMNRKVIKEDSDIVVEDQSEKQLEKPKSPIKSKVRTDKAKQNISKFPVSDQQEESEEKVIKVSSKRKNR